MHLCGWVIYHSLVVCVLQEPTVGGSFESLQSRGSRVKTRDESRRVVEKLSLGRRGRGGNVR